MRTVLFAAFALAVAAATVPTAQAQPGLDVTLTVTDPEGPINATGPTVIPVVVDVGCPLLLANAAGDSITVSSGDAPAWLTVADLVIDPAPDQTCANAALSISLGGDVVVTPGADAPGRMPATFNLTASVGEGDTGGSSDPAEARVEVAYVPGHTVTPDIAFPYTVEGDSVTFNVTLAFTGNARSMIMFENLRAERGSLSGLEATIAEPPTEVTLQVTFTPPDGDWSSSNVTFYNYSHMLLESGEPGDPMLESNPSWRFVEGGSGGSGNGDGKDKDSPLAVAPLTALLLLGLAAAARRHA